MSVLCWTKIKIGFALSFLIKEGFVIGPFTPWGHGETGGQVIWATDSGLLAPRNHTGRRDLGRGAVAAEDSISRTAKLSHRRAEHKRQRPRFPRQGMFPEVHSEGSDKPLCPAMEAAAASNADSSKQARFPLQETSRRGQRFPGSQQLRAHPDRSSLQNRDAKASAFSRQDRLDLFRQPSPSPAWLPAEEVARGLLCREASSAKRPPLPMPCLPQTPLWTTKHEPELSFVQPPSTCGQDPSSRKPSHTCRSLAEPLLCTSVCRGPPEAPTQTQLLLVKARTGISAISLFGFPRVYIY